MDRIWHFLKGGGGEGRSLIKLLNASLKTGWLDRTRESNLIEMYLMFKYDVIIMSMMSNHITIAIFLLFFIFVWLIKH